MVLVQVLEEAINRLKSLRIPICQINNAGSKMPLARGSGEAQQIQKRFWIV